MNVSFLQTETALKPFPSDNIIPAFNTLNGRFRIYVFSQNRLWHFHLRLFPNPLKAIKVHRLGLLSFDVSDMKLIVTPPWLRLGPITIYERGLQFFASISIDNVLNSVLCSDGCKLGHGTVLWAEKLFYALSPFCPKVPRCLFFPVNCVMPPFNEQKWLWSWDHPQNNPQILYI